jgi:hypothetical protein
VRGGVNFIYHAVVKADADELLRTAGSHFESDGMVMIEASPGRPPDRPLTAWAFRHGAVVALDPLPEVSEVLAAVLARLGVVELSHPSEPPHRPSPRPSGPARSEASMSATATNQPVLSTEPKAASQRTVSVDPLLEDAWSEQLLRRYPRIERSVDNSDVRDLREKVVDPSFSNFPTVLDPVLDAVREYELVCRSNQLENVDEARLFEAVVVLLSRNLFARQKDPALLLYQWLEDVESHDVGQAYQDRVAAVIERDAREAGGSATATTTVPPATVSTGDGITVDNGRINHRAVDVSREVAKRLQQLDTDEAATAYSEVKRRCQLMCFCAALWSVEAKKSTTAADVALDERFRRTLTGDAIALFFRARALLVSPVASTAQTQLGLQFVTTALSFFPRNPGMHHTRALFLLRKSSTIVGEAESLECLEQATASVEEALSWDAEFAAFYATRAKIKYRMHNRSGALVDIRAAIELARYGTPSKAAGRDISTWEALLESWDLAPVGVASGSGG